MAALSDTTLVYVAPAPGRSGVGDYADDFATQVRPHFKDVVTYWIENDGAETIGELARDVRNIRETAKRVHREGPTIVHFEQRAGSLAPFWGSVLPRSIRVTATVHDAPQPVWWPFKTRTLMRHRVLHHAAHYPFRGVINFLQRRVSAGRTIFTLTTIGAHTFKLRQPQSNPLASRIFIPERPGLKPLGERPLAVGLFGHVYRGKGFNHIDALRRALDDDIEIVVAGRGTEVISEQPGVTVLGEVTDQQEVDFFESIRFLMVPYSKDSRYGPVFAASSAVTRSYAYGTPIICVLDGSLAEMASEGGAVSVDGGAEAIAVRANTAVRDAVLLEKLADEVKTLQVDRTIENCVQPFLAAWTEMREGMPAR